MRDSFSQLDTLIELLTRLGVEVRKERMGGAGSGLCNLHGRPTLFIDLDTDAATQLYHGLRAAAQVPQVESVYLPPHLREQIDQLRAASQNGNRGDFDEPVTT